MKKIFLYLIGIAGIILVGIYFGWEMAGIIGGASAYGEYKRNKSKVKDKKKETEQIEQSYDDLKKANDEKIDKAGDNIEADTYDNADDAANSIDDIINPS